MSIRELTTSELDDFIRLVFRAYPRLNMPLEPEAIGVAETIRRQARSRAIRHIGYFIEDELVAVMRLHDLQMNVRGTLIPAGGMGFWRWTYFTRKNTSQRK